MSVRPWIGLGSGLMRAIHLFALCAAVATAAAADAVLDPPADAPPLGRLGDAVVPTRYHLALVIDPERETFEGDATIDVDMRRPASRIWIHGSGLEVESVTLVSEGRRIAGRYREVDPAGVARIDLDRVPERGPARLELRYRAAYSETPEGLYRVRAGDDAYVFSHFQASAARRVFPAFDEPGFKVPFAIEVTAPVGHHVITATREVDLRRVRVSLSSPMMRWRFALTPPLPTYLLAFAVGPFDVVDARPLPANSVRSWSVPLRGVAVKGRGPELAHALRHTQPLVEAFERYLDLPLPYPKLDLIAVPDFAAGAMENAGAVTYREDLLLIGTNPPAGAARRFASVHAHELAHQWFGNLVSPRWWEDLWLNESFASWLGARIAHRVFPALGLGSDTLDAALAAMVDDDLPSARRVRHPVATPHDVANAFDRITYGKGAALLGMFEHYVGDRAFRDALRFHLRRFAGGVADTENFLDSLTRATAEPELREMIGSFLDQPGTPLIETRLECAKGGARVRLRQTRSKPLGTRLDTAGLWDLPVCLRYPADDGRISVRCERMSKRHHVALLPEAACPRWIMPNADGTGYYRFALDARGWSELFEHLDVLSSTEARMVFASLSAGFRAGEVSAVSLLAGIRRAAQHPDGEVATAQLGNLVRLKAFYPESSPARAALKRLIVELYDERLHALGLAPKPDEPDAFALNRRVLVRAVALHGADPEWRERLRPYARRYVKALGRVPRGIDPELLETALVVELASGDRATFDAWSAAALDSEDPLFRRNLLGALAAGATSDQAHTLLDLLGAAALRDHEAVRLARRIARNPALDDALLAWIENPKNLDELLARFPERRRGGVIGLSAGLCERNETRDFAARFAANVDDLPGGRRALQQAQEKIERCVALRGRYQHALARALKTDSKSAAMVPP